MSTVSSWPNDNLIINEQLLKLHLGCGSSILDGWMNTDLVAIPPHVHQLDVTKSFPFDDESISYVYSEHMIEHLDYSSAIVMIDQCFRVMKNFGKIRIATPDLDFLIKLHYNVNSEYDSYIDWAYRSFINVGPINSTNVINNFVRDWGHRFIYNKDTIVHLLTSAGFVNCAFYEINQSNDIHLTGLEHPERLPANFLKMETMIIEAQKVTA
jgi:predicted SAM-dependent methyltransferase